MARPLLGVIIIKKKKKKKEEYPELPLLPNLRCGAWYSDPEIATNIPAYFKSTDGHNNNWSFNLRRSNLHLISFIIKHQGFILVDSTRSGKRIPDALSKTVPIWCSVINRAMKIRYPDIQPDIKGWNTNLYTPPNVVSMQEHHQIELRLDGWAKALADSSFDLPRLPCPLRPLWITPATSTFPNIPKNIDPPPFLPVICVSASKQIGQGIERRNSGYSYIQGSGDDHELWGMGLTPTVFWKHRTELIETPREDLPSLVEHLLSIEKSWPQNSGSACKSSPIEKIHGRIRITTVSDVRPPAHDETSGLQYAELILSPRKDLEICETPNRRYLQALEGKKGQTNFLQSIIPQSMAFIERMLVKGANVSIACDTGKDLSVGVALVALQRFFDDHGNLALKAGNRGATKQSIRTRLEWIIASRPEANPSRNTLKRVNEYLLTPASFYSNPEPITDSHLSLINDTFVPETLE
ncbi:tRNA A64-2'-O-ribosylphosphate transferase [Panaeolus papilionaceus]|nr:tRNA A64-2'-O-ribosylphosphate transferase [Panaeolus papilionaceus]